MHLVLRRKQLAERLGVADKTIDRWLREGIIPPPAKQQGMRLWIAAEIDRWIAAGMPPVQTAPAK